MAATNRPPVLQLLELEYTEGGSSPWFINRGRQFVASLTDPPDNANLFGELAREGTMGALIAFLDQEQPSVGNVALVCYILLGFVLLTLFLLLPLAVFFLRRPMASVGVFSWLICEVIFLVAASIQAICLISMFSTRSAMDDGLRNRAPEAYEWAVELLLNYTRLATNQLKATFPARAATLDKAQEGTTSSIKWLRGNITAWEDQYDGYARLTHFVTGPLTFFQMVILGAAIAIGVSAALFACGAWKRRQKALAEGRRSPIFVALVNMFGAVLLLTHLAVALPMIARWLPLCVLSDTYVCTPYRESNYRLLDDGVARVWPLPQRPDPFCRLVPSQVIRSCATRNRTGIEALAACSTASMKALEVSHYFHVQEQQAPLNQMPAPATKKVDGDCYYPYKVVDTEMISVCPLYSDELLGHWGAIVISTIFGLMSALAAAAIAIIFLAVGGKKAKSSKKKKTVIRKRRARRKGKKRKKKKKKRPAKIQPKAPLPQPPPLPPLKTVTPALALAPAVPGEPINIELQIERHRSSAPAPVPVPVPVPVKKVHRRRRALLPPINAPPVYVITPQPPCPMVSSVPSMPQAFMPPLMRPSVPALMASPSMSTLGLYGVGGSAMAYTPSMYSQSSRLLSRSRASPLSNIVSPTAVSVMPSRHVAFEPSWSSEPSVLVYPTVGHRQV